jgi:HEAT repeat protein
MTDAQVRHYGAVALDPQERPLHRVAAWKKLDLGGRATPEMTALMVNLLQSSQDSMTREAICQMFRNSSAAEVKESLILHLRSDPSDRVREQATMSLASLAEDQAARSALEWASVHDASVAVRAMASQGLLR